MAAPPAVSSLAGFCRDARSFVLSTQALEQVEGAPGQPALEQGVPEQEFPEEGVAKLLHDTKNT